MFRAIFCPSPRALDRVLQAFGLLHPVLLSGCGPESREADCVYGVEGAAQSAPRLSGPQPDIKTECRKPQAVKHGLAPLRMGIKMPEIC
jgi:hypothetical protein